MKDVFLGVAVAFAMLVGIHLVGVVIFKPILETMYLHNKKANREEAENG